MRDLPAGFAVESDPIVTFARRALVAGRGNRGLSSPTESTGRAIAAENLLAALDAADQVLDFGIANYLAAFAVPFYADTDVIGWLRGYRERPEYQYFAYSIASAFLWAESNGTVSEDEVVKVLKSLDGDRDVDAKLYIEEVLYNWQK